MKSLSHETDIVSTLRQAVADRVGRERFELWFSGTTWRYDDGSVTIHGYDPYRIRRLESKMRNEITAACRKAIGSAVELRFRVTEAESDDPRRAAVSEEALPNDSATVADVGPDPPTAAPLAQSAKACSASTGAGRQYATLDEFLVGCSNNLAAASTRMVIDQPNQINPLFLYGPPGTGKTHLLESIFSAVRGRSTRHRCVYLTAEQFTSYFLTALHGRGVPSFRQRYRMVDLLVIEDLHFFANKPTTITELQHTMDAVARDGGQLAFSADRSPAELSHLGNELVHRLCGGMVARLEPVDPELRRRLLYQMAQRRGIEMDQEVAEMVAGKLHGDARQIIGALLRLQAYSTAWKEPITADLARRAMEDFWQVNSRIVRLEDVQRVVCEHFGIDPQKLKSQNRTQRVSQPRMLAMWLARKCTTSALSEIGSFFGNRSHSSVVMAEKKVNHWVADQSTLRTAKGVCGVRDVLHRLEERLQAG